MGRFDREAGEIHAKIVYYGPSGAGKTANVEFILKKLKREHRGDLRVTYAKKQDKQGPYEFLPVQLGAVRGFQTSIHVHTVPGDERHNEARRRVLDGVDGVIFVADLRPERHEASLASLEELKQNLESYGRSLDDVLLVIQYNRRDEADETALEKLHAQLGTKPEASFEGIAHEGTGVLQCLTTLSKAILQKMRAEAERAEEEAENASLESLAADEPPAKDVEPLLSEAEVAAAGGPFELESAGPVTAAGQELVIPIRITDPEGGRQIELSVRVTLDA